MLKNKFKKVILLITSILVIYTCFKIPSRQKIKENTFRYVAVLDGVKLLKNKKIDSVIIDTIPAAEKVISKYIFKDNNSELWYYIQWKNNNGWVYGEKRKTNFLREILVKENVEMSEIYYNELEYRYNYVKNELSIDHEKANNFFKKAMEFIKDKDFINAEKYLYYSVYFDVTWARVYYNLAKITSKKDDKKFNDITARYLTWSLDLGYNYLYKEISNDNDLTKYTYIFNDYKVKNHTDNQKKMIYGSWCDRGMRFKLDIIENGTVNIKEYFEYGINGFGTWYIRNNTLYISLSIEQESAKDGSFSTYITEISGEICEQDGKYTFRTADPVYKDSTLIWVKFDELFKDD